MLLKVIGNSMNPLIRNGDEIRLCSITSLSKGDIITVKNRFERVITHRVMDEIAIVTKGDNSTFPEQALKGTSYQLLGKVEYVITPNGQKFYLNKYSNLFFQYSYYEMKLFRVLKKVMPLSSLLCFIRQLFYSIFILIFKLCVWRKS